MDILLGERYTLLMIHWLFSVLKAIISAAMLLLFSLASNAALIDKSIAIVNNEVLTLSELQQFKRNLNLRRELDPFLVLLKQEPKGRKASIQYLLQERLITQKFPTSNAQTESEIQKVTKKIGKKELNRLLRMQGSSYKNYKQIMQISLSKRKLIDRELRPLANVSAEQVKSYYYVSPKYSRYRKKKKQLLHYKLSQLQIPNKALAKQIEKQLQQGVSFQSIEKQYKHRAVSILMLDKFREDELLGRVRKLLQGKKQGDFTKAIALKPNLFVIHKIEEVGNPHDPVFERFKEEIHAKLLQDSVKRQLRIWTEKEKAKSFILIPK